ncbi:MAG: lipoprotein-releasing ABC transporter permease subunit [Desulfuromonadia bacterium]
MSIPFELFIGLRYLRAKRRSAFISIITLISTAGVTVGVMALIVVLAVMTGFEEDLKEKILSTNAHVVVTAPGGIGDYDQTARNLTGIDGVVAATPFIFSQVMLSNGKQVSGVVLRGIDPDTDPTVTKLKSSVVDGRYDDLSRSPEPRRTETEPLPGIVIGRELAKNLDLFVGDPVNVISPMGEISPIGMMPKLRQFRVVAIFNTGMFEYDSTLAYIRLDEAQRFSAMGGRVTGIQLRVADIYDTPRIVGKINTTFGGAIHARDWMQMNRNILFALKTEKTVMFVILSLIVVVAAFGIASTLFMVVMEKTRDIAILKSMGATPRSIMKIFVLEGMIIGSVGTMLGVVAGLGISLNLQGIVDGVKRLTGFELFSRDVYYLDHFPSRVVPLDVTVIALTALAISFVATLYPAWQAGRRLPAEALRYE